MKESFFVSISPNIYFLDCALSVPWVLEHQLAIFIRVLIIRHLYSYTGSVVRYWWRCSPSQCIGLFWGSGRFMCWKPFVFFGFTTCVLLYDNTTNTRMLVTFGIPFKRHLTLGILRSAISHLTGCFVTGPSFRISDSTWCHRTPLCYF